MRLVWLREASLDLTQVPITVFQQNYISPHLVWLHYPSHLPSGQPFGGAGSELPSIRYQHLLMNDGEQFP